MVTNVSAKFNYDRLRIYKELWIMELKSDKQQQQVQEQEKQRL